MKVLKFRTNISDAKQIEKVSEALNKIENISRWSIDTDSDQNILSVSGEEISLDSITLVIKNSGFNAELLRVVAVGGHDL
ncbi:MAG: copper chaperone [Cytophagaceae bacterium]